MYCIYVKVGEVLFFLCGFIFKDYSTEIKDIKESEIDSCIRNYHSIDCVDYYIFSDNSCLKDTTRMASATVDLNLELLKRVGKEV